MKILILFGLGKATDSFAIGHISPLGTTYCKKFVQKPVDRGLKDGFLGFFEISFPTTQNIYAVFKSIEGLLYVPTPNSLRRKVRNESSIFWRQIHGCHPS